MSTESITRSRVNIEGYITIITTVITIIITIITVAWVLSSNNNINNATILLVQDQMTGNGVVDAVVSLEVAGKEPLDSITDARGFCQFMIPDSFLDRPGRIIVEAEGYQQYTQKIDLAVEPLPNIIEIEPMPPN